MNNETAATDSIPSPAQLFCDWRLEVYNCKFSGLWITEVSLNLASYAILFITGSFIFFYRYKHMWKGLFVDHAHGIRPLPVDNLLFFSTLSCFFKGLHSLLMLSNAYSRYWQREFMQEIGWTMLCYGGILYLIGKFYFYLKNIDLKKRMISYI